MNRRQALLAAFATTGAIGMSKKSEGKGQARNAAAIPGAVPLRIGQKIDLDSRSTPVRYKNQNYYLMSIDQGVFEMDGSARLTAKLHTSVQQWARIDYWISVAIFDAAGRLLGTASHKEEVRRIQISRTMMIQHDIALDFGVSKAFANAAFFVVAISERDVPAFEEPGNGAGTK